MSNRRPILGPVTDLLAVETPTGPADAVAGVRITPVDTVGLEQRAASLCTRSIKTSSKAAALDLAIQVMDLTTLEGADTPERVQALCARARHPDAADWSVPPVAAVCVYPELVPVAVEALADSSVAVASVAGGFPAGLAPLDARLAEIAWAVAAGADEVDIVLNRSAFCLGGTNRPMTRSLRPSRPAGRLILR